MLPNHLRGEISTKKNANAQLQVSPVVFVEMRDQNAGYNRRGSVLSVKVKYFKFRSEVFTLFKLYGRKDGRRLMQYPPSATGGQKFASSPLDYMGIYKYLMGKVPNMHAYLRANLPDDQNGQCKKQKILIIGLKDTYIELFHPIQKVSKNPLLRHSGG